MPILLWPSGFTERVEEGTSIGDLVRTSPGLYLEDKNSPSDITCTYRKISYVLEEKEYLVRGTHDSTEQELREEISRLHLRMSQLEGEVAQLTGNSPRGRSRQRLNGSTTGVAIRSPLAPNKGGKRIDPRKQVIEEILATESAYLDNLRLIETVFHANFVKASKERRISGLTACVVEEIFGDIAGLIKLNTQFFEKLKVEKASGWKECRIGHLFLSFCEHFRAYSSFVASHKDRISTLRELRNCDRFFDFLSKLEASNSETLSGRNLNDLLIHPVKRVPQYIILLERLTKYTSVSHPDYSDLCAAQEEYDALAHYFEEKSQKLSDAKQVLQLMSSFHISKQFQSMPLINPQRSFCFEDQCEAVIPGGSGTVYRICAFSDCLIFLVPRRKHKRNALALRRNSGPHPEWTVRYWLDNADVRDVEFIADTSTIRVSHRISREPLFISIHDDNQGQWEEYIDSAMIAVTSSTSTGLSTPKLRRTLSASFDRPQSATLSSPMRPETFLHHKNFRLEDISRPASFDAKCSPRAPFN